MEQSIRNPSVVVLPSSYGKLQIYEQALAAVRSMRVAPHGAIVAANTTGTMAAGQLACPYMLSTAWHDNERNQHDIMPNGFCMWHDGGMTGSMTVRLSCHGQADT